MLISVRISKNFLTTKFKKFPRCDLSDYFPINIREIMIFELWLKCLSTS